MKNQKYNGGGLSSKYNSLKLQKFKETNTKRKVIVTIIILSVLLLSSIYLYNTFAVFTEEKHFNVIKGTVSDPGDIYFAYYVNNTITRSMPKKGTGYTLDTEKSTCTNGVVPTWDDDTYSAILNFEGYNATDYTRTRCELYFKKAPINIITALDNAGFATYNGTNANYGNVIAGTNPNNYIYFNCDDYNNQSDATCEKWRVLSFGPTTLQNGNTARLVKIRRAESIGKRQWSTVNDYRNYGMSFEDSSLFTYLNNTFFDDLKNSVTQNMISSTAKWYGGSIPMSQIDSIHMNDTYTYVSKNTINDRFQIGLVNAYEYAYSAGNNRSDIYWCLNVDRPKYNWGVFGPHEQCAEKSWIYDSSWPQWTMTESDDPTAVIISQKGEIGNDRVIYSYNVFPVLYLDNTLKIGDGDGSSEFPYQIVP